MPLVDPNFTPIPCEQGRHSLSSISYMASLQNRRFILLLLPVVLVSGSLLFLDLGWLNRLCQNVHHARHSLRHPGIRCMDRDVIFCGLVG